VHELGVVLEVVKAVEEYAAEQHVQHVETVVLQIGELSSMVPRYVEQCWPVATDGTSLEDAELLIQTLPANARCKACGRIHNVVEHRLSSGGACPFCASRELELLGGREFIIKEIVVDD
jgi:hydrogenase nickel incorporation protein HypA/HybF